MPDKNKTPRPRTALQLDPLLIRALCDLNPLEFKALSANCGFDGSVLSNFFAGRRSLPKNQAPLFLAQLGLNLEGQLNSDHAFVWMVRPGQRALAAQWLARLFPRGGTMAIVSDQEQPRPQVLALYDGTMAAVVHDMEGGRGTPEWLPGSWGSAQAPYLDPDLLDLQHLPAKASIAACLEGAEQVDPKLWNDPRWDDVKREVLAMGMTARELLGHLREQSAQMERAGRAGHSPQDSHSEDF